MSELNWVHTALVLLAFSTVAYLVRLFRSQRLFQEIGWGCMLLSLVCLVISLVLRSKTAQYFALSNMYESLLVVTMWMQVVFLWMDRWFAKRALGFPVSLFLMGALLYDLTLPTNIAPLQPALQSYWRSIHVPIILLSYALFTLSLVASLIYLIKDFWQGKSRFGKPAPAAGPNLSTTDPLNRSVYSLDDAGAVALDAEAEEADVYDEITYRCVAFGFPLLAIGIILGGMWANEAWGNYWSWDPKESMSLVTLLCYGVYLHLRVNGEHHPRTLALVSVGAFVMLLVTYFGVNIMGLGLHSYGKIG
jgi:cytochrome c-type biogenesis protein CcsB